MFADERLAGVILTFLGHTEIGRRIDTGRRKAARPAAERAIGCGLQGRVVENVEEGPRGGEAQRSWQAEKWFVFYIGFSRGQARDAD